MPKLVVTDLSKTFPSRDGDLSILDSVNFCLAAGDSQGDDPSLVDNLAVLGPSGSGKSTLLHILGTLDEPSAGKVLLDDEDPFTLAEKDLARFRNHNIGFIFQEHHLLPQLSVVENVVVPAMADGRVGAELLERAHDLVDRVGLSERRSHRPAELSGGERQRAAVARALLLKPKLLLADEPTGSLDRANAQSIGELLLDLQQQEGTLLVVVTHSEELAAHLKRRLRLIEGKLTEVTD
ncbi:ABC transporter ATP-binding protein [Lignipirellula cremea]|uniref:Lipoprotein-releasing system ATP-binding protein LolD n=1 Tax=Lignipirellula cremea TaxID=2528010 RepID=A0A518DU04_9BACT|nr:ABC transporter ATP-binding protein [Lignipirellula cremea]QDU95308.1 Lipoprotein-releasing system ATP-binding protein LolD [Lignipirellula cremea]